MEGYTRQEAEALLKQKRPDGVYRFAYGKQGKRIYRCLRDGEWRSGWDETVGNSVEKIVKKTLEVTLRLEIDSVIESLMTSKELTYICDMNGNMASQKRAVQQMRLF